MAPDCQEKNLKGLTMVAVGVNKSADQYLILDERTQDEMADGKFHDQRRGSFGTSAPTPSPSGGQPTRRRRPAQRRPTAPTPTRRQWTPSQERLAVLYNAQGLRPEEIAAKLGIGAYTVTQIILTSKSRGGR
jgi:hypothetical protein